MTNNFDNYESEIECLNLENEIERLYLEIELLKKENYSLKSTLFSLISRYPKVFKYFIEFMVSFSLILNVNLRIFATKNEI